MATVTPRAESPRRTPTVITSASDGKNQGLTPDKLWPNVLRYGGFAVAFIVLVLAIKYYAGEHTAHEAAAEQSAPVHMTTAITPSAPAKFVWDGSWNRLSIPAGVGSKSDITPLPANAEIYTESGAGAGHPFSIECRREVPDHPGTFEVNPVPCGAHTHFFDLVNNTGEAQDADWHPGPIVN